MALVPLVSARQGGRIPVVVVVVVAGEYVAASSLMALTLMTAAEVELEVAVVK